MKGMAARKKSTRARARVAPDVGSEVRWLVGTFEVKGTVIEDRGNLGVGGRRIVRIRYEIEGVDEPLETEMPVDDLLGVA